MINTAKALYEFWSGFGIPAYTIGTVPDDEILPYITYSLSESEPLEPASHYAQLWYRTISNSALLEKVDVVKETLGNGVIINCDGGYVSIRPSSPLVQLMVAEDPEVRCAYINLQINCYHL